MSIRTKLILSFLSLLIVPFIVIFLALVIMDSNLFGERNLTTLAELDSQSVDIENVFIENVASIYDSNYMDSLLEPYIDNGFSRVLFVDYTRKVIYDSQNKGMIGTDISEMNDTISDSQIYVTDVYNYEDDMKPFSGTLYMIPKIDLEKAFNMLLILPIILIGLFIVTIIGLIFILSKILADGIINPLRELNYAAERIAAGDLDFQMAYDKDDEFGKLCNEFDHMRIKLKESLNKQMHYEKSRRQLIASISHDLKTPLTSIKGYVEGLQDGLVRDEETYKRYLKVIWDKSNRLNHLIDDLFIFSKLELGEFRIEPTLVDADMLLDELTSVKEMEFKDHKIQFVVHRPFPQGKLQVDIHRIGQVLDNLIDNALKFTRTKIELSAEREEGQLIIYIKDDGIGMPEEDLPYIFNHFYKIDKARSTGSKGTGLGLAICKELIEAHGGSIFVKSRQNVGTIFKIALPIQSNSL